MARPATLLQLRTRLQQRTDTENDLQFTAAELTDLVNEAITECFDELVMAAPPDYYLADAAPIVTTAGAIAYDLPDDFYKLRAAQVDEGGQRRRSLLEMQPEERLVLASPIGGETVYLEYIPCAAKLVANDDAFDGVNGWEELVVLVAATNVFLKKRTPNPYEQRLETVRARIKSMAYRDAGTAPRLHRTRLKHLRWPWWTQALTSYRVRGATIELFRAQPSYP